MKSCCNLFVILLKIALSLYRNQILAKTSVILIDVNCTIFDSTRLEIGIRALKTFLPRFIAFDTRSRYDITCNLL